MTARAASATIRHTSAALRRPQSWSIRSRAARSVVLPTTLLVACRAAAPDHQWTPAYSLNACFTPLVGVLSSRSRQFTSSSKHRQPNPFDIGSQVRLAHTIKSLVTPALFREIQEFWFLNSTAEACVIPPQENVKRWFMGGEALDKECVEKFLPTLEALRKTGVTSGTEILDAVEPTEPCDWMSLLILLDQIPRNCYRGASSSVVFNEFDPIARDVARAAIEQGLPDRNPEIRWQFAFRSWFYMPLMHSEDLMDHEQALDGFRRAVTDVESLADEHEVSTGNEYHARALRVVKGDIEAAIKMAKTNLDFEQMHYDIIRKFGRYPHRNKELGREATAEEKDYLEKGGHAFG
ncbi:hypothetical protein J3459_014249 [Metarhizium acridum]|nr:hypothetical protein J3459_014249 [Metarhizium acridum]